MTGPLLGVDAVDEYLGCGAFPPLALAAGLDEDTCCDLRIGHGGQHECDDGTSVVHWGRR